jgi:hypothetical protein
MTLAAVNIDRRMKNETWVSVLFSLHDSVLQVFSYICPYLALSVLVRSSVRFDFSQSRFG